MKMHVFYFIMSVLIIDDIRASDNPEQKFSTRVKVEVTAEDGADKIIKSFLNRELRSLVDVNIVEDDPEWIVAVAAVEVNINQTKVGYAVSSAIIQPFNNYSIMYWLDPKYRKAAQIMTSDLVSISGQNLRITNTDGLQRVCKEVIAEFDSGELDESRNAFLKAKIILSK